MSAKGLHKIFHAKILLFGEQIINKGATGLAVPVPQYDAVFKYGEKRDKRVLESNKSLELFAHHIIHTADLEGKYDTNQLLEDVERGLYFDSFIPQGYGLGSSGALVAAVYFQYRKFRKKNIDLAVLKKELAELEGYFHGKSSGLDALVCYLNKAVIIANGEIERTFDLATSSNPSYKVFLMNTHISRNTSTYVNLFLDKCKDTSFMNLVEKSLIPANNLAIDSFLQKQYTSLMSSVRLISQMQLDKMPEFIPKGYTGLWKEGLKHNNYTLKICGAGGGGFIIGFAKADMELSLLLSGHPTVEIFRF